MIEYRLDDLGWEGFEQLVQSLLKARLGLGIEAWGGSGDWGRDAYFYGILTYPTLEPLEGGFVFQCKFVEGANAAGSNPEKPILDAVRKEHLRIEANLRAAIKWTTAPTCYSFFTNACLSPKIRTSINQLLTKVLPNSKVCIHDGRDVCQWLRLSPEVVSSFEKLGRDFLSTSEEVKELGEKIENGSKNEIRAKLNLAQILARQEKKSEGIQELEKALALAQAANLAEEEVEVLLALGLLSSSRRGIGNRRGYLDKAKKKIGEIKDAFVLALYFRAKAAACKDERDHEGAEEALLAALQCCEKSKEEQAGNLEAQACVIRSDLIILLCEQGRHAEAAELVTACDAHACTHINDEDGELMQAAMSAGIFWALKSDNEAEAVRRIKELETVAKTADQALRIGGQLSNMANNSSHMGFHQVALAAAEAAVRLGQKADDNKGFLVGALYTLAVITLHSGNHVAARRMAESLLDACNNQQDAIIKQAAAHLIAEIVRVAGDSETAVTLTSAALASASGRPEEVAFTKQAAARALSDNGQTEEALAHAVEAYELMRCSGLPAVALADALFQIVSYSSVLGRASELSEALNALSLLEDNGRNRVESKQSFSETKEKAPKLAEMNTILRERIIKIATGDWGEIATQSPETESLEQANAQVIRSLLGLWEELPKASLDSAATGYDFWGRGNFARIVRNAQSFPTSFNITLEVRTLDGLKQAIRLWTFYADMLLLIWKGPTQDVKLLDILPETILNEPGGAGYLISIAEKDKRGRHLFFCMSPASLLPVEVIAFLMNEARPLLAAGRLIVVPATGVGCVHPGYGPLEQLLTESANAIAGLRSSDKSNEVPIGMMPYSPDAPFDLLADIVGDQQNELRKLRRLLIRRTRELAPKEAGVIASKELSLEIDEALHDLASQQNGTARKHGLTSSKEPLKGSFCSFYRNGSRLQPNLGASSSPFAPLLTLKNFGYRWGVGCPGLQSQGRYEPGEKSVVGPWLAPPTERWSLVCVKKKE